MCKVDWLSYACAADSHLVKDVFVGGYGACDDNVSQQREGIRMMLASVVCGCMRRDYQQRRLQ